MSSILNVKIEVINSNKNENDLLDDRKNIYTFFCDSFVSYMNDSFVSYMNDSQNSRYSEQVVELNGLIY